MSNYRVPVEGGSETEDRKRKFENSCLEDDQKRPKLNTSSLGLSLLQAYEGELSSDEDEDDWKMSNEETFNNVDSTLKKDTSSSVVDYNPPSLMVEEEEEINLQESDVLIDEVDESTTDQLSIGEDVEETFVDPKNEKIDSNKSNELDSEGSGEKLKNEPTIDEDVEEILTDSKNEKIDSNKLNELDSEGSGEKLRNEPSIDEDVEETVTDSKNEKIDSNKSNELDSEGFGEKLKNEPSIDEDVEEILTDSKNEKIDSNKSNELDSEGSGKKLKNKPDEDLIHSRDPNFICIPSNKLDDVCLEEIISGEKEKKSESIRPDYNFSVFGTEVNSIDLAGSDSKPTKKVKLNRSKFVRPADESSNETRTPPAVNPVSIVCTVLNVTPVTPVEETPSESDNSINDTPVKHAEETPSESDYSINDISVTHVEETPSESDNSINDIPVTHAEETPLESDNSINDTPVTHAEEMPSESDNSINDSLSEILTEEIQVEYQVESAIKLDDETVQEVEIIPESGDKTEYLSFDEESTSNNDVDLAQQNQDGDEASDSEEPDERACFISVLEENMDSESTNEPPENLLTTELIVESVPLPENLEPQLVTESVSDSEQLEDESLQGDVHTVSKDTLPYHPTLIQSITVNEEEIHDVPDSENEDVEMSAPEVDNDSVKEVESPEEDHREANVTVFDDDSNKAISECTDKLEENQQESEIVELNEEEKMEEDIYVDPAKPEIEREDDTEKPASAMEITNELSNEQGPKTREEERSESMKHVIETIERTVQDGMIEKTLESVPSKHIEISKLEQALTGRLENSQPSLKMPTSQTPARKGRPPKVRPAIGGAKQNIKLHLSVQGDRVSILNNTQSTPETPSSPAVRVKRQYRKRTRVPGELEAQQANAKEYTHRLRQRTERETPGAKKRTRKKKNQEPESSESKTDPAPNPAPADLLEKVMPLTVAINKLPSEKKNLSEKVEPIKLKIRKNPNVTLERSSEYDVCLALDEENRNRIAIGGIPDEARRIEEPLSSNGVEKTSTPWSEPDLQRVERFLKGSNVTITPVACVRDLSTSSTSLAKPIVNLPENFKVQATPVADTSPLPATSTSSTCESDENSKNLIISLKADADERNSPWKIVKSPQCETAPSPLSTNLNLPKPLDVKSEIRKKIASVEKRKQDVNAMETESIYSSQSSIDTPIVDISLSSSESDAMPEDRESDNSMLQHTDIQLNMNQSMPFDLSSVPVPVAHKTPTGTPVKHPRLPVDLFPKKRGRPTKAMVAAREAYWQKQEEMEKSKIGDDTDGPVDVSVNIQPTPEPVKIVKKGRKMKSERFEKKDSDDLSYEEMPYDPDREAEEQKRVEEEKLKKEEERERKNELRRLRAKERSDVIKAKRLRQKMKAKERHKMAKELRRLQQEEKKKLEEQLKRLPTSMGFDDDTRMSAENSQAANISFSAGLIDDDSSGATNDLSQKLKKSRMEVTDPDSKDLMVDQIAEYQWPIQGGDLYMIQEQVSNFLGVKSFKRKYPDIWRRPVDSEERAYLVDSGLVSETLCDLGITAVRSAEVLDIMCSDFPEKYEEFRRYMREKQMKELSFKQRAWANGLGYKLLMADGSKQDMKKRAMESVSNWNSALNKSRVDDRRCHMDLQTFIIHYPKQRGAKMTVPSPKVGSYPVPILPGQFCDFYKEYTPTELRYLPVNTVLYGPLKHPSLAQNDYISQTDSDDSSSSDDSSTTSEDTQATEETLEDLDSSTVLDGNNLKFDFKDASSVGDEEQTMKEMNGDRDPLAENDASKVLCKICLGDEFRNKMNVPEVLISCSQCASANHPTCLDLSLNIVSRIKSYAWQCPDCKICAQCKENADEDKMLFCDTCDQGYHIYCVGLIRVPAGNWQCKECSRLKERNGSIADVEVKKEYVPLKKEVDFQTVEITD